MNNNNSTGDIPIHQVTVSGIGAISAAGNNIDANFANMISGVRSPKPYPTIFNCDFQKTVFECDSTILQQELLPYKRTLALALTALKEALGNAELEEKDLQNKKVGVCIGTTVACTLNNLQFYSDVRSGDYSDIEPIKRYIESDIAKYISNKLKVTGPVATIANACASGTNAIAAAYTWIKSGLCDIVIAGGADELNMIPYCGFNSLQVMSSTPCLPFDKKREGLNLGEGAGILILESSDSAEKRGLKNNVYLASFGGASDAFHLTGPHPEGKGLKSAITAALQSADIKTNEIDYINAHGTATLENDKIEALVFNQLSESHAINYSSTKYYTGHTLGAAGAIEAAICVKGMQTGLFPGHPALQPDPGIIKPANTGTIPYKGNAVLSTSMAFGGSCSALLFTSQPPKTTKNQTPYPQEVSNNGVKVASIGILGPFGRGIEKFSEVLDQKTQVENSGAKRIQKDTINDPDLKRIRRRADKLSIAMLCAAKDAVSAARISEDDLSKTALISVTGFGAHNTTFKFLDGVIDYGQTAPSPTHFSNSVHNAPSFYITTSLKIKGLSVTFTGLNKPFTEALHYAEALINSGEYKKILLVAGDEVGDAMLKISEMWYKANNTKEPEWGEGAVAFLLTAADTDTTGLPPPENHKKIEDIFGTTLINDAFEMAADNVLELIKASNFSNED